MKKRYIHFPFVVAHDCTLFSPKVYVLPCLQQILSRRVSMSCNHCGTIVHIQTKKKRAMSIAIKSNQENSTQEQAIRTPSSTSINCMVKGLGSRGCILQQGCAHDYLERIKTGLRLWQSSWARVVGHGCGHKKTQKEKEKQPKGGQNGKINKINK